MEITAYSSNILSFGTISASKSVTEGDIVPLLYNEHSVDAEIYKINNDKILLRHEKWEWIDRNSNRLFPTQDMIKNTETENESDDDLYFSLNTENISSNDEENNSNKYEIKNKKLAMFYEFANNTQNDNITLDDIHSCIKVLKKIKKSPHVLNTPSFAPIHCYLRQISDISNSSSLQLILSSKLAKKQRLQELRSNDNELRKQSGIRITRQQRANESEIFRQFLEKEMTLNTAIETAENDADIDIDDIEDYTTNDHKDKMEIDEDNNNNNNIAVLSIEDKRELIEVHGQTLTTCSVSELSQVVKFIERNNIAEETTAFEKGTIICDYDGAQRLDLCKQQIGPINTSLITNAMRCNDKISALLMGANGIGDDGAKCIADLIKNNKNNTLSTVFLGCNLIKKEGIKALCDALSFNESVKGLWLKRNLFIYFYILFIYFYV